MAVRSRVRAVLGMCLAVAVAAPAPAQLFFQSPDFKGQPVTGADAKVLIPLPGATTDEMTAETLWTLRAGLNFAALQCQFAPSLMTVNNYNALLTHHSKELAVAYKLLQGYFKRTAAKGTSASAIASAFDNFNTRTYSSFSTVFAQVGFCQTASRIGEDVLLAPKGTMISIARTRLGELRNSLTPIGDSINVRPNYAFSDSQVPGYAPECFDKKGNLKKKCLQSN